MYRYGCVFKLLFTPYRGITGTYTLYEYLNGIDVLLNYKSWHAFCIEPAHDTSYFRFIRVRLCPAGCTLFVTSGKRRVSCHRVTAISVQNSPTGATHSSHQSTASWTNPVSAGVDRWFVVGIAAWFVGVKPETEPDPVSGFLCRSRRRLTATYVAV